MSRLSKQSIAVLCTGETPMIHPFEPGKVRLHGTSKGLSHASYDASIAHDLVLGRHPGYVIKEWVEDHFFLLDVDDPVKPSRWYRWPKAIYVNVLSLNKLLRAFADLRNRLRDEPPCYSLAHTVEDFHMPPDVGGDVADKSTFARLFVSLYNTFFDPGFHGNATLEIVNDSDQRVHLKAGQGVCQFIFTWLDEATIDPYNDTCKYQGQTKAAHGPRLEVDNNIPPRMREDWLKQEVVMQHDTPEEAAARQRDLDALRFGRPSAEP
jgi:deoxycytidine triphosphate deaminase